MASIPKRAQLIRRYSHVVFTRLQLREPTGKAGGWAEASCEQYFEDTAQERVNQLMFLSALLLYENANYAHGAHLASLKTAIRWLNAGLEAWMTFNGVNIEEADGMPAKGSVAIDIKTLVPREQKSKLTAGVTLYANDEEVKEIDQAIRATNVAMVIQLGKALMDIYAKASPSSAVGPGFEAPPT